MVTRTYRDSFLIQERADIMRMHALNLKRQHGRLDCRGANNTYTGHAAYLFGRIIEQLKFLRGNRIHAERQ